jgi:hypothetical protein
MPNENKIRKWGEMFKEEERKRGKRGAGELWMHQELTIIRS